MKGSIEETGSQPKTWQSIYNRLRIIVIAAKKSAFNWGLGKPNQLIMLTDKDIDSIYIIIKKLDGKITNGSPNKWEQISVMEAENPMLMAFIYKHCQRHYVSYDVNTSRRKGSGLHTI